MLLPTTPYFYNLRHKQLSKSIQLVPNPPLKSHRVLRTEVEIRFSIIRTYKYVQNFLKQKNIRGFSTSKCKYSPLNCIKLDSLLINFRCVNTLNRNNLIKPGFHKRPPFLSVFYFCSKAASKVCVPPQGFRSQTPYLHPLSSQWHSPLPEPPGYDIPLPR